MYEAPTIDSDIHVHSIKSCDRNGSHASSAKMDQLHGMRKDRNEFLQRADSL